MKPIRATITLTERGSRDYQARTQPDAPDLTAQHSITTTVRSLSVADAARALGFRRNHAERFIASVELAS